MVRVVEESPPWSYGFTCRTCGSVLEAEGSDVARGDFGSMGESEMQYYVRCPVCHSESNFVPYGKLTPKLRDEIESRSNRRGM